MFILLPNQPHLGISPEQVVAVIESINTPNIAANDDGTEAAKAYIVGLQLPSGGFSVAIYLHLLHSNSCVIYRSEPLAVALEHYPVLEAEAIQFTESMGFMLENLNFRAKPPQEMARLVEILPFFRDLEPILAQGVVLEEAPIPAAVGSVIEKPSLDAQQRAALGRLLSSF